MKHTLEEANKILGTNYKTWGILSMKGHLSEDFIREYQDKVYWDYISIYQKLSESFIREFRDKVDWYRISDSQKLSESFIREFKDKLYWCFIAMYQVFSQEFASEFLEYLLPYIDIINRREDELSFKIEFVPTIVSNKKEIKKKGE